MRGSGSGGRAGAVAGATGFDRGGGGKAIDRPGAQGMRTATEPWPRRKLGMSRRTLHRKLHLYQLEGM